MNKRGIYKITNPKGKIYIGQSINIEKRKKDYEFLNCKKQYKILNSIKKYGWDKHSFELIEECSLEQLNERERYWQDFYNVLVDGLNLKLTQTNDKSGKHSNETIQKLKNYWSDYYTSNNGHNLGKKQSKETCLKKSKSAPSQPILQYDLDGNFIREWERIRYAEKELGIHNQSITMVCQGKKDSAGGFQWSYKNSPKEIKQVRSAKNGIPILQYDLDNNLIKEWPSTKIASLELKIDNGQICSVCKGKGKSAGGYIWKYK